jgi:hypothetical protein
MKNFLLLLAPALLCASCVAPTPQSRIARNPQAFASLSTREKHLVEEGQLSRGMRPAAVLLAWGEPSRRYHGEERGKPMERWDYTTRETSHWDNFYSGPFYDPYGPYGYYPYRGYGFGPTISAPSIPVLRARVTFINGRVASWERRE